LGRQLNTLGALLTLWLAMEPTDILAEEPMTRLTHQAVQLKVPHWPRNNGNYAVLRDESLYGDVIDKHMIPALQAEGSPEARIRAMMDAANAARTAVTVAGKIPGDGLSAVEIDLKVGFLHSLAAAIATGEASPADKKAALESLLPLPTSAYPVGLPENNTMQPWTLGAQLAGRAEIAQHLEAMQSEQ